MDFSFTGPGAGSQRCVTALHNMPWFAAKRILIRTKHTSSVCDVFIAWKFLFSSLFSPYFGLTTEYSLTSFVVHAKCTSLLLC